MILLTSDPLEPLPGNVSALQDNPELRGSWATFTKWSHCRVQSHNSTAIPGGVHPVHQHHSEPGSKAQTSTARAGPETFFQKQGCSSWGLFCPAGWTLASWDWPGTAMKSKALGYLHKKGRCSTGSHGQCWSSCSQQRKPHSWYTCKWPFQKHSRQLCWTAAQIILYYSWLKK